MHKSQASLEFLSTYAWAFIILVVTISILYYFGVFNFSKFLPQKCSFPSQLKCLDFSLKPSEINVRLLNNIGEDIQVTSLDITNDAITPIRCNPQSPFSWTRSTSVDVSFTSCRGGGYLPDERVELVITLGYYIINTPSRPIHYVKGKINGKVTTG